MNLRSFIAEREPAWQRLEQVVGELARRGPRGAGAETVEELIHLYRQVSADLAQLRTAGADPERVRRLNRLVGRAYGQLHGGRPRRRWSVWRFYTSGFPRVFRANARFTLASFLVCLLIYMMAYRTVQHHPEVVADILGGGMDTEFIGDKRPEDIADRFRVAQQLITAPGFTAAVATNNIQVALTAFALGITFGLGTLYILIVNSAMLGGIAGAFAQSGIEGVLWATILPHGALELSAIVVAGAAGLRMGWALWCPGQRTRGAALREGATAAVLLVVGLIPAFLVAAFIEGYVTPSDRLGDAAKLAIGFAAAIAFWAHLAVGGREAEAEADDADHHAAAV